MTASAGRTTVIKNRLKFKCDFPQQYAHRRDNELQSKFEILIICTANTDIAVGILYTPHSDWSVNIKQ